VKPLQLTATCPLAATGWARNIALFTVLLTCGSGFRSTIPDDQKAWAPGARSRLPSRFTPCITTVPWLELGNETLTPVIFTAWLSLFFSSKRNTSFAGEVLPDVVGARGR